MPPHWAREMASDGDDTACITALTMGTEIAMLGVEAQMVIGQRMAMFMLGGPKARKEAQLMVTEKVKAAGEAAMTIAMGGTPRKVFVFALARSLPRLCSLETGRPPKKAPIWSCCAWKLRSVSRREERVGDEAVAGGGSIKSAVEVPLKVVAEERVDDDDWRWWRAEPCPGEEDE